MRKSTKKQIRSTVGLAVLSLVILLAYGVQVYISFKSVDQEWRLYNEKAAKSTQSLLSLNAAIGYGGFIHNFKNYVLRFDENYVQALDVDIQKLTKELDTLETLNLSSEDNKDIQVIRQTFQTYVSKISIISNRALTLTAQNEVDQEVQVDDTAALAAINNLLRRQLEKSQTKKAQTQAAFERATYWLLAGSAVFLLIILTTVVIVFMLIKKDQMYGQQSLMANENELLFFNAPDATIEVDRSGRIKRANKQAELLFEYTKDELDGMLIEDLMPDKYRAHHVQLRDDYFKKPTFRAMGNSTIIVAKTKSNKMPILQISLSYQNTETGMRTIASIRDVTESHDLQKQIAKANTFAQQAMKAKNSLLSNMSHELRTPLNHILGFSDLLLMDNHLSEKQQNLLQTIRNSGQHQLELIESILDLATLSDLSDIHMEDLQMYKFIEETVESFKIECGFGHIPISYGVAPNFPKTIAANKNLLSKVLQEILLNACKFNNQTSTYIQVFASTKDGFYEISVQDNGVGIPSADFDRVFNAFERLDAHEKAIDGIGSGLTTCQQIIQSFNGKIWFEDMEKGCCLKFKLPIL